MMIPMPDSNTECGASIEDDQSSSNIQHYMEEKKITTTQTTSFHLCSTPPLSVSPQGSPKMRNRSPGHYSKKERILQSLVSATFANNAEKDKVFKSKADSVEMSEPALNHSTKETIAVRSDEKNEPDSKQTFAGDNSSEKPTVNFSGKMTWLLVGENGKVLWRETTSKEKMVSFLNNAFLIRF